MDLGSGATGKASSGKNLKDLLHVEVGGGLLWIAAVLTRTQVGRVPVPPVVRGVRLLVGVVAPRRFAEEFYKGCDVRGSVRRSHHGGWQVGDRYRLIGVGRHQSRRALRARIRKLSIASRSCGCRCSKRLRRQPPTTTKTRSSPSRFRTRSRKVLSSPPWRLSICTSTSCVLSSGPLGRRSL